jgi:hypothetical protein
VPPKVLTRVPIRFTSLFVAGEGRVVEEESMLGVDQQTASRLFFALLNFLQAQPSFGGRVRALRGARPGSARSLDGLRR